MRPVTFTLTTVIPALPEQVFAVLSDPMQMSRWIPAARAVEATEPLRKGSRLRVIYDTRQSEIEIVDMNRPNVFGWAERSGRRKWNTYFQLEFAGAATRLTVQQVWTPPSILAWLKGKVRPSRNVRARLDGMVQNLRTVLAK